MTTNLKGRSFLRELDFTAERHTRALESVYEGISRSTMAAAKKWPLSTRSSAVTGSNG